MNIKQFGKLNCRFWLTLGSLLLLLQGKTQLMYTFWLYFVTVYHDHPIVDHLKLLVLNPATPTINQNSGNCKLEIRIFILTNYQFLSLMTKIIKYILNYIYIAYCDAQIIVFISCPIAATQKAIRVSFEGITFI